MRKRQEQRCETFRETKGLHPLDQNWVQIELDKGKARTLLSQQYEKDCLWRDRRSGFDRRQQGDRRSQSSQQKGKEQRSPFQRRQRERRRPEIPEIIEYRRARTRLREQLQAYHTGQRRFRRRVAGGITGVVSSVLLGLIVLLFLSPFGNRVHCNMPPRPGVDWNNCLLSDRTLAAADLTEANLHSSSLKGADLHQALLSAAVLSYANLAFANLRYADLSRAVLRGANLHGANLSHAMLDYADLSYADLSGANLEETSFQGAKLDYTVWYNRRECAPGSIGTCQ